MLKTTERADDVLFRGEQVRWRHAVHQTQQKIQKPAASRKIGAAEQSLFDALRSLRSELARQGSVPAYVIFRDASLLKLAEIQPTTEEALLCVPGIGEQKAAKYGQAVLAAIAQWRATQPRGPGAKAKSTSQPLLQLRPDQLARYEVDPAGISMTEFARRLTAPKDDDQSGELTGRQNMISLKYKSNL